MAKRKEKEGKIIILSRFHLKKKNRIGKEEKTINDIQTLQFSLFAVILRALLKILFHSVLPPKNEKIYFPLML